MVAKLTDYIHTNGIKPVIGFVVAMGLLLGMANMFTGYPVAVDYSIPFANGLLPDVLHERATAFEALWGDAHRPISEILLEQGFERYGYEDTSSGPSPRPPSALLLQTPLLLIPENAQMPVVITVTLCLLLYIGWLALSISGIPLSKLLWAAPVLVASLPVVASLAFSPLSGVILVALILTAWRFQNRPWAGVLLGVAFGLRLFPGIVVVGFWLAGRKRLAYQATGTFVLLTFVGVLLPGVTVEGSIASLSQATDSWISSSHNASMPAVTWRLGLPAPLTTVAVALVGLWAALRNRRLAVPITLLAALIASPLSWPVYALAAVPIALSYADQQSATPILTLAAISASWRLIPWSWLGAAHLIVLVALFLLIVRRPGVVQAVPPSRRQDSFHSTRRKERPGSPRKVLSDGRGSSLTRRLYGRQGT